MRAELSKKDKPKLEYLKLVEAKLELEGLAKVGVSRAGRNPS